MLYVPATVCFVRSGAIILWLWREQLRCVVYSVFRFVARCVRLSTVLLAVLLRKASRGEGVNVDRA